MAAEMETAAIIVAAGSGRRAGGTSPKQLALLGGRPMLEWSLVTLACHRSVGKIVLVVPPAEVDFYSARFGDADLVVGGGVSRAASVLAGLRAMDGGGAFAGVSHVLIHDAARPGLDTATIDKLIESLGSFDGAAPALPVVDALKRQSREGLENIDRTGLWRVQTPQAFRLDVIRKALEAMTDDMVDDLAAAETLGAKLTLVEGSERLAKVTYPDDFARMERLLGIQTAPRIGTGFDVHALEPGDGVILCGVKIPHSHRLKGHSDADVAWHALTDAILGAAALGDIGDHFPPSDPQWAGAASEIFLREAARLVAEHGFGIANCDLTIICEAPKVKPHREAMRARTAEVLGLELGQVSVKATTTEQLGFTGRREGIAAQAAVVLTGGT